MPDITMCTGDGCSKKNTCYRFTATPGHRQSYFCEPPIDKDGNCDVYLEVQERVANTQEEAQKNG
jgi:hypothetical protein